jgi:two-component system, OmpR family, sensor histidine kinase TctE
LVICWRSRQTAPGSLRRLLLGWLLLPLLALLGIGVAISYAVALRAATQAYDRALLDPVLALAQHIKVVGDKVTVDLPEAARDVLLVDSYDRLYYEVRGSGNVLIAGAQGFVQPSVSLIADVPKFYDGTYHGSKLRVAALRLPKSTADVSIQVGETLIKRDKLVWEILLAQLVPAALMALAAFGLVWFGIGRGLKPLERLRAEISARSQRDLRSVPQEEVPREVRPLVQALNELLQNLRESQEAQQRFLANAAHQLRTPLAGLQTQLELALRRPLPDELHSELTHMREATQRTAHLANQLLALARAEPGAQSTSALRALDLRECVSTIAAEWVPRALAKDIDLGFDMTPTVAKAEPLLIRELLANLIDNALRYTPAGGTVTVRCHADSQGGLLQVEDNGPGIPTELREKVVERFYRIDASAHRGCGLGLAIVNEIANVHGARLTVAAPPSGRGTLISVVFPKAA